MTQVTIYKNPTLLKFKLLNFEPKGADKRKNSRPRVAFCVDRLDFDHSIPILRERHLEEYLKRHLAKNEKQQQESDDDEPIKISNKVRLVKLIDDDDEEKNEEEYRINLSEPEDIGAAKADLDDKDDKEAGNEVDDNDQDKDENCSEDEGAVFVIDDEQPIFGSSIDKLILNGPEEDEFKQYDNDDNDEDQSTISKNLKKIRTEPVKPPAQPIRQTLIQQPFSATQQAETKLKHSPPPIKLQPIKHLKTSPKEDPNRELTPEELEKTVKQKNWRLVYTELDRNQKAYKTNAVARSVLKQAILSCLELDETYELINLMKLVFEYEYPEDTNFWEMLIGKLKRKLSPHSLDHRFKCETDPKFVINNYTLVLQEILKHFNSSNTMSNVRIAFHLASYLAMWGREKEMTPLRPSNMPTTALIQPMPAIEGGKMLASENQNILSSFDVSLVKVSNGNMHFKIKSSRRESKFSPRFL